MPVDTLGPLPYRDEHTYRQMSMVSPESSVTSTMRSAKVARISGSLSLRGLVLTGRRAQSLDAAAAPGGAVVRQGGAPIVGHVSPPRNPALALGRPSR